MSIGLSFGERGIHISGFQGVKRTVRQTENTPSCISSSLHLVRKDGSYIRAYWIKDDFSYVLVAGGKDSVKSLETISANEILNNGSFVMAKVDAGDEITIRFSNENPIKIRIS